MRKILSTVLALAMVLAAVPFTALAEGTADNNGMLIGGNANIELDEQVSLSGNRASGNLSSINAERESITANKPQFSAEEIREMTTEEFVKKSKDTLPKNYTLFGEDNEKLAELKDPALSENETIRNIAMNKKASEEKLMSAIEYGEKLEKGEIETTASKSNKLTAVDDVMLITNEDDLKAIAGQDGYFRLACDINLTTAWEPVDFYGTLEGGGHTITGATMQYSEYDYVGFFSLIAENAVVKNLTLCYPYVYANSESAAFCAYNQGTIDNCHVENGTVVSYLWADYEYAFWEISGHGMGGLVGTNEGYIMNSSFTGNVDGWHSCASLCAINAGYVFACFANGNVCYETNTWDYDQYGYEYFYNYGYIYYPPFTTMLRMQWAAFMLLNYDATAFGYNGGLVGENYYAVFDCSVQGSGEGNNYNLGVVAGLDCVGGLVGGDAGWCSHNYVIDKAFPVLEDGAELYAPWEYGDEGYGIYYDHGYFLVHKGIALNYAEVTCEEDQIFFYGACGLPCDDGLYHGTELTADQFVSSETFADWNHGEWNAGDVWIISDGYIPIISDIKVIPNEYVMHYQIGNSGGMLDGEYEVYKIAKYDEATNSYLQPVPPKATNTANGYGIEYWTPVNPYYGNRTATQDMTFTAYFGRVGSALIGDANLDGRVNTGDAVCILKAVTFDGVGQFSYQQLVNSDTTFDASIGTADAVRILRYVVGYINEF